MNIYEKINKIMGEVSSLKKDGKVAFGNTRYNFLSEAKTTQIFREKFVENKLVLLPIKVSDIKDGSVTKGHYIYRLLNVENPEEFIDLETTGQGHDSSDKGSGKASTYAYKYLLWRTFAIPSNDDPDNISSAETTEKTKIIEKQKVDSKITIGQLQKDISVAEKKLEMSKANIVSNRIEYIGDGKDIEDYVLYLKTLNNWIETGGTK
jgi:hypothetical protein